MLHRLSRLGRGLLPLPGRSGARADRLISRKRAYAAALASLVLISAAVFVAQQDWLRDESSPAWSPIGHTSKLVAASDPVLANDTLTLSVAVFVLLLLAILLRMMRKLRNQRGVHSHYKAIIEQANDGIVVADSQTHQLLDANPAFLAALGYATTEVATLSLRDVFDNSGCTADTLIARLRAEDFSRAIHVQLNRKDGTLLDVEMRCNPLDADGRSAFVYVMHDVSVRRKAEQQLIDNQQRLDRMAHHDQLTGLPNRHHLATFLPNAIAEAAESGTMLGIVFIDLDRFKHINDTRGHEVGDRLLQEVAIRIASCVRENDVVIRMGGDEFVVVFQRLTSSAEVTDGAARIVQSLNGAIHIDHHPLQTTASVGVSIFPRDGSNMAELLKHSDTAMYEAKDRGRNNVQMFSPVMNRRLKQRVAVESSLREALRLKQFELHYQPFVDLISRKIVGLEALVRWRHPVLGMIPPDRFISVAEETGLIVPIGNFVLHRTLQDIDSWRTAGIPLVPVSVNVAPAQLQRGELEIMIPKLLKARGIEPALLQLEMTERALFDHRQVRSGDAPQNTIASLRDAGIKIAIDDFGTGYSSLSYLKHWHVDTLKIDRSFVRDLPSDTSDFAIVSAIIAIARHLHIEVIAEGIEGYQQAQVLEDLGCSLGQGYLFARPMPADDCSALLRAAALAGGRDDDMLTPTAVFA